MRIEELRKLDCWLD